MRAILVAAFAFVCLSVAAPLHASAATNIYYSVGSSNSTNYMTNSPTVTIDGSGNATFSTAQTSNSMGVGDVVTYGGTASTTYITGKVSTTVWTVETATGGVPVATTSASVTSIKHVFSSLSKAIGSGIAGNATSSSLLNTSNLVAGNYILNIPCYNDTGAPETTTGNMAVAGYTDDSSHYIRVYTPTSTASEVNQSQRHNGTYNTAVGYAIQVAVNAPIITINDGFIHIDGIQIDNSNSRGEITYGATASSDGYLSNSIFSSASSPQVTNRNGGSASYHFHFWNNLFIGTGAGIALDINNASFGTSALYNNTFYNFATGISRGTVTSAGWVFVNNLFASTTNPFSAAQPAAAGSDYNSTDKSALGYAVSGGGNTHDVLNAVYSFYDISNANLALVGAGELAGRSADAGALDLGTSSPSLDSSSPFSTDIIGSARPYGSAWDIGAYEYTPLPDTTPPGVFSGAPTGRLATTTTATTISVSTNENATCKYDTVAGTAYASMPNTFTTTGSLTHSKNLTGLSSGHLYVFYVKCQDTSGNTDASDYSFSFFINQGADGNVYANSCSVSDTNAAMAYVYDGNTFNIPAGTCGGYSSSFGLAISKAITVTGAGIDQTILQIASTTGSYGASIFPISAPATVKNMTIETDTSSTASPGTEFVPSVSGWRITNVKFLNQGAATNGYFVEPVGSATSGNYGLIDHCTIIGNLGTNEIIFVKGPTNSWQTPNSMGTSQAVYIEDSTFSNYTNQSSYVTDCNANARCAVRHNNITGSIKLDGHGLASNGSPARGVRQYEAYNNTWTYAGSSNAAAIEMRGGTGMLFNNSQPYALGQLSLFLTDYGYTATWANFGVPISSISVGNPTTITTSSPHGFLTGESVTITSANSTPSVNSTYTITVTGTNTFTVPVSVTVAGTTGNADAMKTPFDFPIKDQIGVGQDPMVGGAEPFYVWGNTRGGSAWPRTLKFTPSSSPPTAAYTNYNVQIGSTTATYSEEATIVANRDFYADAGFDTGTTTVGVTKGVYASIPATCTTGQGYWATDQGGDWDTSNGTSSDGALYKCSSPNTWSLYYTPYAYPHYLTAASTTASDQVDIGAGARMFGVGKFYGVSTSTATGVFATVGATTTSQDPDAWLDMTISLWSNTGSREKTWTETSTTMGATTTHHMVGDLAPSTTYAVNVDGSLGTAVISGANCVSAVCTSDSSGKIYFDYTGGYSTHTFDVQSSSPVSIPTVLAPTASALTQTSATASSTLTATGGANATSTGFVYGATTSYGATTTPNTGSFAAPTAFTGAISALSCGTTYHFAAFATNSNGIAYSSDATFTTSACGVPTLIMPTASAVTQSSAVASSTITATGGANATSTGFVYGLTAAYGATTTPTTGSFGANTPTTGSLTSLSCGTTYHFAAFATNSGGVGYSPDNTLVTSACGGSTLLAPTASSITQTSATASSTLTATGGANATSTGFVYGATTSYGATTTPNTGSFGAPTAFSGSVTGLSCNTLYHFAAFSTNSSGLSYGPDNSFTTSPCAQGVTTSAPTSVASSTMTLNASITSTGGANATQSGFAYGTNSTLATVIATTTLGAQTGTISFSSNLTSLTPNTLYYFRAYTVNSGGTSFGSILSTTTLALSSPTVTTQAVSSINATAATANGTIASTGDQNATVRGFVYGATTSYGATTTSSGDFGTGAYTGSLSGLSCNTAYHVNAYATNPQGTSYGSDVQFTTSPCAPTVTTSAASAVTSGVATLNGAISSTGGANATQSGFAYSTDSAVSTSVSTTTLGAQTGAVSFSDSSATSLACSTTYYARAYATNSAGTAYGSIVSFSTSPCAAPVVGTLSILSIDSSSAFPYASVSDTGGADASVVGFAAATTSDLSSGVATSSAAAQSGTFIFYTYLSSLSCNTTYYVRAYATNPYGTGFGSIGTFTTAACAVVPASTPAASGGGGATAPYSRSSSSYRAVAADAQSTASQTAYFSLPPLLRFIEVLIKIGVIPPEKAAAAMSAVSGSAPASVPHVNLQYRDKGQAVKSLQTILESRGYLSAAPNGVFGAATLKALKAFQKANGVPATGYFGPLTRAVMEQR